MPFVFNLMFQLGSSHTEISLLTTQKEESCSLFSLVAVWGVRSKRSDKISCYFEVMMTKVYLKIHEDIMTCVMKHLWPRYTTCIHYAYIQPFLILYFRLQSFVVLHFFIWLFTLTTPPYQKHWYRNKHIQLVLQLVCCIQLKLFSSSSASAYHTVQNVFISLKCYYMYAVGKK